MRELHNVTISVVNGEKTGMVLSYHKQRRRRGARKRERKEVLFERRTVEGDDHQRYDERPGQPMLLTRTD